MGCCSDQKDQALALKLAFGAARAVAVEASLDYYALMKITIEKLGRLQQATFDMSKDILVFVGPNNTSKTYAAYLIYGLSATDIPPPRRVLNDGEYAFSLFGLPSSPEPTEIDLGIFIDKFAQNVFDSQLSEYGNSIVQDTFSGTANLFGEARIQAVLDDDALSRISARAQLSSWAVRQGHLHANKSPNTLSVHFSGEETHSFDDFHFVLGELAVWTLRQAFRKAAILPAERSAIQLFSRELLLSRSEALEQLAFPILKGGVGRTTYLRSMVDLARSVPRYPLPIRDTLKVAGDLATLKHRVAPFAHLADWIERQILQGKVHLSAEGQLVYIPDGSRTNLELHFTSSSVKSLSLLIFYLRHVIDKGDLLIIDEPELNLHPDNQRRVARLLARLSRAGVQVLLSTHSDYIVRELNNLIMLSHDQDGELRADLSYDEEEVLSPERVGVYLFGPTSADPVPVTKTGFAVQTIDQEINSMNNSAERIYMTLFGGAEQ